MMPVIRISDPVFGRLQKIATPFVDTPASVIERLLDFYESRSEDKKPPQQPSAIPEAEVAVGDFDSYDPPDLKHTRILKAQVAGQKASSWNELVHAAHRMAAEKLKDFEALRSASLSNIVKARKSDRGFHYLADVNISIQNDQSNLAWRNALHLSKRFDLGISADFERMDKEEASMPGKQGRLLWTPNRTKSA